ncbi:glutamate decarboxylase [Microdochium nivale]|nr:glutamate decarboxylase [Microdochium nivale]
MGDAMEPVTTLSRAGEADDLISAVKSLIVPWIDAADQAAATRATGNSNTAIAQNPGVRNILVDAHAPEALVKRLGFSLPMEQGTGRAGFLEAVGKILKYSVNTWDQGFLDKLSASTNAVGVASELLLSVLNANVHVYKVSPVLTVVEKTTTRDMAALLGFRGPHAGGIFCQGGSASNLTSLVTARNALYPECRLSGNGSRAFVVFTSISGHYSVEKAARTMGLGSAAVVKVAVDASGRMDATALHDAVIAARKAGGTPLYVNATAGTTVLGAYDPIEAIATVCREFGMWLHVDASWGGPAAFSAARSHKLTGAHHADSITVSPHKMLNVPLTCSMLLTNDTAVFHRANTLPADYLFHDNAGQGEGGQEATEVWDLADLTLQCGRRGDALKFALAWIYYGAAGFAHQVDHAFDMAAYMATLIEAHPDFELLSSNPPPCLQVCFFYAPGGGAADCPVKNTERTVQMAKELIDRGFMVDYASGDRGKFFRVVMNCQILKSTVEGLVKALEGVGAGLTSL